MGCFNDEPPSAKQRKEFIEEIIKASYTESTGKFNFIVNKNVEEGGATLVCEAAYLILLGLSKDRNASQCSYQWKNAKNRVMMGKEKISLVNTLQKHAKLDSAVAYIEYITSKLADTSPYAGNILHLLICFKFIYTFKNKSKNVQHRTRKNSGHTILRLQNFLYRLSSLHEFY